MNECGQILPGKLKDGVKLKRRLEDILKELLEKSEMKAGLRCLRVR